MPKNFLKLLSLFVFIFVGILYLNPNTSKPAQAQTGWTLVWADEFNGSGQPSSTNWNYHVGNGWNGGLPGFAGWGNGEWEWYRPENCYQQGGNLVMRADYNNSPTNIAGRDWYQRSCRITTDTKRSIQYGAIEARIQLPAKIGTWPAFWMMGDACDDSSTSNYNAAISYYDTMATNWSSCGEVDIMEHRNTETIIFNNLFWDVRTGLFPWAPDPSNQNNPTQTNVGNVAVFRTYRLEWTSTTIKWLVDGNVTKTQDISAANMEEFRKPFHLIMNLALSGQFTGNAEPNKADFPLYMNVDYVRVYSAGGPPPTTPPPTTPLPTFVPPTSTGNFTQGVTSLSSSSVKIWFKPTIASSLVDVHYLVNGANQQNFRMTNNAGTWEKTVTGLSAGNVITYWFTYEKGGPLYDTSQFTYTVGGSGNPTPAGDYTRGVTSLSGSSVKIWFKPTTSSTLVDVHYLVNGANQQNFRMTNNAGTWEKTVTGLSAGNVITYWFTYEKGGPLYDTPQFSYTK